MNTLNILILAICLHNNGHAMLRGLVSIQPKSPRLAKMLSFMGGKNIHEIQLPPSAWYVPVLTPPHDDPYQWRDKGLIKEGNDILYKLHVIHFKRGSNGLGMHTITVSFLDNSPTRRWPGGFKPLEEHSELSIGVRNLIAKRLLDHPVYANVLVRLDSESDPDALYEMTSTIYQRNGAVELVRLGRCTVPLIVEAQKQSSIIVEENISFKDFLTYLSVREALFPGCYRIDGRNPPYRFYWSTVLSDFCKNPTYIPVFNNSVKYWATQRPHP